LFLVDLPFKNHAMRCEAAKALAAHGAKAASALPALDVAVAVADKAQIAMAMLERKSKAAAEANLQFDLFADPDALAAVRSALEADAWKQETPAARLENASARVLRYLADPSASEFANIPSYSSDRPNPNGELALLIQVGEAARAAAKTIRG